MNAAAGGRRFDGAAFASLGVLTLVWGYNWVVMKIALHYAAPFTFAAQRTLGGGLCLLVMLFAGGRFRPRHLPRTLLLGLLQTTLFISFTTWALVHGGAGKSAVLVYTMPFWVIVLAPLTLGERMPRRQWPPVALAFLGLLLILQPWHETPDFISSLLALAAGFVWALAVLVAKTIPVDGAWDLLALTGWQMLFGALPLCLIAVLVPAASVHWTWPYVAALVYNIVPSNALAWLLWLFVVGRLTASLSGLASLAIPVVGVLAGLLQLGERPQAVVAAGMLLILAALALIVLPWPRAASARREAQDRSL